jgi:hypothetical protein
MSHVSRVSANAGARAVASPRPIRFADGTMNYHYRYAPLAALSGLYMNSILPVPVMLPQKATGWLLLLIIHWPFFAPLV